MGIIMWLMSLKIIPKLRLLPDVGKHIGVIKSWNSGFAMMRAISLIKVFGWKSSCEIILTISKLTPSKIFWLLSSPTKKMFQPHPHQTHKICTYLKFISTTFSRDGVLVQHMKKMSDVTNQRRQLLLLISCDFWATSAELARDSTQPIRSIIQLC